MNRYEVLWLGLLATATAYEIYGLRHNQAATLSEATRRLFQTRTTAGKYLFFAALGTAAAWYANHIVDV